MTQTSSAASGFESFGLSRNILRGIEFAGYIDPRPIQAEAIPTLLEGGDVLGLAQTGTGKTAAFALPILQQLSEHAGRSPSVLILAPTRELASQINSDITELGQFTSVRSTTVYGGVPIKRHIEALRSKPEIVVACPGRLLDLHRQRAIDLSSIRTLVIDEADHMLDLGFLPDVRAIIDLVPGNRQTMLFSATMPKEIRQLADSVLHRPKTVDLGNSKIVSTIDHELYPVSQRQKLPLLQYLLNDGVFYSAIVFTRTKHRALRTARQLKNAGFDAVALQGNMSQPQRDRAMKGFRDGRYQVLVATDIASRGIDVANISYVINFDFPSTPDAYIHRIGRTGRSEQTGKAFTFMTPDDEDSVAALERKLGKTVNRCVLPEFAEDTAEGDGRQNGNTQTGAGRSQKRSKPESALEAAQRRLNQRSGGQDGDRSRRPGGNAKTHGGHQSSRGRRSRSRHRKHARRAS